MIKWVSHARQLRYDLQARQGIEVSIADVAEAVGVDRRSVMLLELNRVERVNRATVEALARFYASHGLDGSRVMVLEDVAEQAEQPQRSRRGRNSKTAKNSARASISPALLPV